MESQLLKISKKITQILSRHSVNDNNYWNVCSLFEEKEV